MIEYLDTTMLIFILSTVIYLVKKTSNLCHDVEDLQKESAWQKTKKDIKKL
tara:strand:- start:429 stop:581 length:153 start_codon:yes stop_codon:yes gene_type:complete